MRFEIAGHWFDVERQWDLKLDGESVAAWTRHYDGSGRLIYLDAEQEGDGAVDTLRHEHLHAWEFEAGGVRLDAEDRAQFHAMVSKYFDRDFVADGGIAGLMALPIKGTRPRGSEKPKLPPAPLPEDDYRRCGLCGRPTAPGSVVNGQVKQMSTTTFLIDRWMRCQPCRKTQVWEERCDPTGFPTGGVVSARMLTDKEAVEFHATHPVAALPDWDV